MRLRVISPATIGIPASEPGGLEPVTLQVMRGPASIVAPIVLYWTTLPLDVARLYAFALVGPSLGKLSAWIATPWWDEMIEWY